MGGGLINMGPLKLFSSSFWRGIDPHSGSVYPHSGCLCYKRVEGETPDNYGVLKVVFQTSGDYILKNVAVNLKSKQLRENP